MAMSYRADGAVPLVHPAGVQTGLELVDDAAFQKVRFLPIRIVKLKYVLVPKVCTQ
jgi:hypothetical protein